MGREPDVAGLRMTFIVAVLIYSGSEAGFRLLTPVWICSLLGAFILPKRQLEVATVAEPAKKTLAVPPPPVRQLAYANRSARISRRALSSGGAGPR
jgi:hypothetical protein